LAALEQTFSRGDDAEPWAAVAQALRSDPMGAALDVQVGDAPEPEEPMAALSVRAWDHTVHRAVPVGGFRTPPPTERQHPAIVEMWAIERAQRGAGS
jgi:hypothetical protein